MNIYVYKRPAASLAEEGEVWLSQKKQYPPSGEPGVSYFKGDVGGDKWVDCFLFRNEDGELQGVLNYFGFDFPGLERKGNYVIWVDPKHQRKGIGLKLLQAANDRFAIDFENQMYTVAGAALLIRFLKEKAP